jgi:ligand-binding sensor domain-containing protein
MAYTKAVKIFFKSTNQITMLLGLLYIICFSTGVVNAQQLLFKSYTTANGLSQNSVYSIAETDEGFTWFGTQDGLNRFDGNRFLRFVPHNIKDEYGTPVTSKYSRQITALCADSKLLWVGTSNGLLVFDLVKHQFFLPIVIRNLLDADKEVWVLKIKKDKQGNLWILTKQNGLFYYNVSAKTIVPIQGQINNIANIIMFDISNTGVVWCCTSTDFYFCKDQQTLIPASGNITASYKNKAIVDMAFVNEDIWFLSTITNTSGILKLNNNAIEAITPLQDVFKENIVFADARLVYQTDKNTAWIGTRSNGLYKIDLQAKTIMNANDFGNDNSLRGAFVLSLFTNKQHVFWVGLSGGGVAKYDPNKVQFDLWKVSDKVMNQPPDNMIFSVFTQDDKNFYMGTLTKGLLHLHKESRTWKYNIPLPSADGSTEAKNIYGIIADGDHTLWLATWGGLYSFDKRTNAFKKFIDAKDVQTIELYSLLKINNTNKLIVGSAQGAFRFFNMKTQTFEKPKDVNHVLDTLALRIRHMQAFSNGDIYLATETRGLVKYNYISGLFQFYPQLEKAYSDCRHFYIDGNTCLLATTNGLLQVTFNNMRIEKEWTTNNGLPNNYIYSVAKDSIGNIWVSSNLGLASLSATTGIWQRYTVEDGLSALEYNTASICKTPNGSIWFGGVNGLNSIRSQALSNNSYAPKPIFTAIKVMGQPFINDTAIPYINTIRLPHFKNFISFEFQTPLYSQTENIVYEYQLTSVDTGWVSNGNKNFVNYTQLKPGVYTFLVRSANASGIWCAQPAMLTVIITPPWYGTKWFMALALLFSSLVAIWLYKRRIRNIEQKAATQQKIAEIKMQSLRAQMNPHFIFNSLNSIENFIMRNEKRLASDYLNKFSQLVRSILDSSLNEMVPIAKDMSALKWYVELEQLRFNNKFSYKEIVDPVLFEGDYRVPALLVQPYVENAVLHGLANSDRNDLWLSVEVLLIDSQIKYIISDNGVGRHKAAEYNVQNKPNHKSVGLKITQDRINLFNKTDKHAVVITDTLDNNGNATGTKVEVTLNLN